MRNKRQHFLACAAMLLSAPLFAETQQPPYDEKSWETNENFRVAFLALSNHVHDGRDGSNRMPWVSLSGIENPTANNTQNGECGIYSRGGYIVLFCNDGGSMHYVKIDVVGAGTTWTTGAP